MVEVVQRLGTTPKRRELLRGLLRYRGELRRLGFAKAFQWIDGSFVENLAREPSDLDVVTFSEQWPSRLSLSAEDLELLQRDKVRARFSCDAYFVPLSDSDKSRLVNRVAYWFGLFSHRRSTLEWKGLVHIELDDAQQDADALLELEMLEAQEATKS